MVYTNQTGAPGRTPQATGAAHMAPSYIFFLLEQCDDSSFFGDRGDDSWPIGDGKLYILFCIFVELSPFLFVPSRPLQQHGVTSLTMVCIAIP